MYSARIVSYITESGGVIAVPLILTPDCSAVILNYRRYGIATDAGLRCVILSGVLLRCSKTENTPAAKQDPERASKQLRLPWTAGIQK